MFCATVHVVVSQVLLWKFCAGNWWSWPRLILKPMLDVWQLCCGLVKNFPKEFENGWKVKCTTINSASRVSNVGTTIWVQAGIACPIWIHREKKKCFFDFDHHFRDHKDAFARSRIPQANQVPAVRWSSCEIRVMAKLWEFVWECLQTLLWIKKYSQFSIKIPHFTSTVHRLLSDHLLCWKEPILASYPFLGLLHKGASLQNWQSKRNLNFNPSTIKLNYIYSFKSKNQTQLI